MKPLTKKDREDLYDGLYENFPAIDWKSLEIVREEIGVRPLLGGTGQTSSLSREASLEKYDKFSNVWLVLGGKLTTARALMANLAVEITGKECPASKTTPLVQCDAY